MRYRVRSAHWQSGHVDPLHEHRGSILLAHPGAQTRRSQVEDLDRMRSKNSRMAVPELRRNLGHGIAGIPEVCETSAHLRGDEKLFGRRQSCGVEVSVNADGGEMGCD